MQRFDRDTPLPPEMQGEWIDAGDPTASLIVTGGEITCYDKVVEYDFKLMGREDGAVIVSLQVENPETEDDFQNANITDLVITPEGEFHAYNVGFSAQFVRPNEA
ncbi:MAG: hypothetical protein AAFZ10_01285 [Pseudomonadota bacterium]